MICYTSGVSVYKRGGVWWYSFTFAGKRIQESAKTRLKTLARAAEEKRRRELEESFTGVSKRTHSIRGVGEVVASYLEAYGADHKPKSLDWARGRLTHVDRLLGRKLLSDLDADEIRRYIKARKAEGAGNRTINMEVAELSRAIGRPWSHLWPKLRSLEEPRDKGRALSKEEEGRVREAAAASESAVIRAAVPMALLTGMRRGEILSCRWSQIDFDRRIVTVGNSKSEAGRGRQIPMNDDLQAVLAEHRQWFEMRFGPAQPDQFLFPFGTPHPSDPSRPITTIKKGWSSLRERAGVECRFHDLRHTAATKMAEAGVAESSMLAIMGHMSRAMLERYSHIRMQAKRDAVQALNFA